MPISSHRLDPEAFEAAMTAIKPYKGILGKPHLLKLAIPAYLSVVLTRQEQTFKRNGIPETHLDVHRVLMAALEQTASGKGQKRHGRGLPFKHQPILALSRMNGLGGLTYQIGKKAQEAVGMHERGEHLAAKTELLGAIIYAAAGYLLIEEREPKDAP